MTKLVMAGLAAVGVVLLPATQDTPQDRFVLEGNPAVYALAGEVEVVRGTGRDVVVQVELRGPDADQLSIEVDEIRGRASLRVRHPDEDVVYDRGSGSRYSTTLRVRSDGTWGSGMSRTGGRRVTLASAGQGIEAHAVLRIEVPEGRDLNVFVGVGGIEARGVTGDIELDVASGSIRAEDIRGYVSADTGSGDIVLQNIEGSVDADTGSGDIRLDGVRGDRTGADTGSGDVIARRLVTDRIEFDTGSGRIEALDVESPEVTVDTGSGDIELAFISAVRRLSVDSGSGDVTLRVPRELSAEIEAHTGSGQIEMDIPGLTRRQSERRQVSGVVGSGQGSIEVDTGSGSIRIVASG